jgi:hypothetical protein
MRRWASSSFDNPVVATAAINIGKREPDQSGRGNEIAEKLGDHALFKSHSRFIDREQVNQLVDSAWIRDQLIGAWKLVSF